MGAVAPRRQEADVGSRRPSRAVAGAGGDASWAGRGARSAPASVLRVDVIADAVDALRTEMALERLTTSCVVES